MEQFVNLNDSEFAANNTIIMDNSIESFGRMEAYYFIRPCYEQMYMECVETFSKSMRDNVCIIIGNPGIGKSMFGFYLIRKYIKEGKKRFIIYNDIISKEVYVFDTVKELLLKGSFDSLIFIDDLNLTDSNTYLIQDIGGSKELYLASTSIKIVVISSPDESHYNEMAKDRGAKLYMSPWTQEEVRLFFTPEIEKIIKVRLGKAISQEQALLRYKYFGGIIRAILHAKVVIEEEHDISKEAIQLQKIVDSLFQGVDIAKMFNCLKHKTNKFETDSNFILCYDTQDYPNFKHANVRFNSPIIARSFYKHVIAMKQEKRKNDWIL